MTRPAIDHTDHSQDELQKAAEEQRRHEEKERLFKLEEARRAFLF